MICTPTIGAHQGALAAAARPEQPGDGAARRPRRRRRRAPARPPRTTRRSLTRPPDRSRATGYSSCDEYALVARSPVNPRCRRSAGEVALQGRGRPARRSRRRSAEASGSSADDVAQDHHPHHLRGRRLDPQRRRTGPHGCAIRPSRALPTNSRSIVAPCSLGRTPTAAAPSIGARNCGSAQMPRNIRTSRSPSSRRVAGEHLRQPLGRVERAAPSPRRRPAPCCRSSGAPERGRRRPAARCRARSRRRTPSRRTAPGRRPGSRSAGRRRRPDGPARGGWPRSRPASGHDAHHAVPVADVGANSPAQNAEGRTRSQGCALLRCYFSRTVSRRPG